MDNNTITFTKEGIKVKESITSPLTKREERERTLPYSEITNQNPLNIRVVAIIPKFSNGMLTEIELKILNEEDNQGGSGYHDMLWHKQRVLDILSDKREWKKESIYNKLKAEFNQADYKKMKSGNSRGYEILTIALNSLKGENKVENPRKGLWKLR
jgi:hypothetical protein